MSKKKNQDKSKKDPLQDKLAKFKNKSIHDRLAGKNTSNITSKVDDNEISKMDDIDTSNVTGKVTNNVTSEDESNDTSNNKSNITSKNNINDVSNITSKVAGEDTSKNTSNDTSKITGKSNIKEESNDYDIIPAPPLPAKETKKAATFYFDKDVHDRFERYVKDQIKTQKLKSSKVKSYYAQVALDFFLKSQGY